MTHVKPTIAGRRARFRQLHESGCFLIPNPWDVGSARYLQHLGFAALASTRSGSAFAQGRPEGVLTLDEVLEQLGEMGVRRVSVGCALAAAAWGGFMAAANSLANGRFDGFARNAAGREIHAFFQSDQGAAGRAAEVDTSPTSR